VIGQGPEEQRLRYTIHDLGLEEQVQLLGKQPPEVVRTYLQAADAFLLSSLSEGIANAALEAMACGVPVVTTDCGGMREAVTHSVEGWLTPVRQPVAMAQALQKLWEDPALRPQMGTAGRHRVVKDFNLDQQISQFLDLFQRARL
jgi:colanic acid/amylovoran biosynthesis glycosyltransferase